MPPRKKKDLVLPGFTRYFFMIAVLVVMALFFWVISPFFDVLIYAALTTVVFYPLHKLFQGFFKKNKTIPALLSTIAVVCVLLAPLTFFAIFITQEAIDAYYAVQEHLVTLDFRTLSLDRVEDLPWVGSYVDTLMDQRALSDLFVHSDIDVATVLRDVSDKVGGFLVNQATALAVGLGDLTMSLFIMVLTIFYFFRDGDKVLELFKRISPLPKPYEDEIEAKLKDSTHAIVVGNFGTALAQGFVGAFAFWLAGVDHVIFWGTIMSFASLIPYVGATIIWVPVALSLFFQGEAGWAIFVAVWGMLVVSSVDNFLRPVLIRGKTKVHPLATFLVVLGGILVFGIKGMIFGPLILSLAVTILHIYQLEYKDVLKA